MSNHKRRSPLKLFVVGIICGCLALTIVPRAQTVIELDQRKQALEIQKAELLRKNQQLEKDLQQTDTPQYIEKIAREKLGMVKPGEKKLIPVISN